MNGLVHSINISEGGVPKLPVSSAKVEYGGLEEITINSETKKGIIMDRAVCLFSLERIEELEMKGTPSRLALQGKLHYQWIRVADT